MLLFPKILWTVILLLLFSCQNYSEAMRSSSVPKLKAATEWFIRDGIPKYYTRNYSAKKYRGKSLDDDPIVRELNENFGVYIQSEVVIDKLKPSEGIRKSFLYIKFNYHGATAACYVRERLNTGVYEYWIIKLFSNKYAEEKIEFILLHADDMNSKRKIVHRSSKFLSDYTFPNGTYIDFPKNNFAIGVMQPDLYSEAFLGTFFEGKRVRRIKDGGVHKSIEVIHPSGGQWREKTSDGARQIHFINDRPIEFEYQNGKLIELGPLW